jgi:hypothetical protein
MPHDQSQDQSSVSVPALPPYEPDLELIGLIERGQHPAAQKRGRNPHS